MKKAVIILFVIGMVVSSYAQSKYKPKKSTEPYKSKSGYVFNVGDTLHLAKASMPDRSFKCGWMIPNRPGALYAPPPQVLNTHFERTTYIIKHFLVYTSSGKEITYAYFDLGNDIYHGELMIDCAIDEGELIP